MATPTTKVIRTHENAKAAVKVTGDSVIVAGNEKHVVVVNKQGITLRGPISLGADSSNIRHGGLFIGMNDFLKLIPSTQWTPIPQALVFPPVFGLVGIARDIAFFASLLI